MQKAKPDRVNELENVHVVEHDYVSAWLGEKIETPISDFIESQASLIDGSYTTEKVSDKTLYLYLVTGDVKQPELQIAQKLGFNLTRSVMKQPPLEDLGEQDVRCLLTEYHNSHNADFDFIPFQLTRQHDKLQRVIEDYENQGYHVNKIVI